MLLDTHGEQSHTSWKGQAQSSQFLAALGMHGIQMPCPPCCSAYNVSHQEVHWALLDKISHLNRLIKFYDS